MLVRAICDHLQPPLGRYRTEGEEFDHDGPLYDWVDPVESESPRRRKAKAAEPEPGSEE